LLGNCIDLRRRNHFFSQKGGFLVPKKTKLLNVTVNLPAKGLSMHGSVSRTLFY
jgi:hypothetical protein